MAQNQKQAQESTLGQKSDDARSGKTLVHLLNLQSLVATMCRDKSFCSLLVNISQSNATAQS